MQQQIFRKRFGLIINQESEDNVNWKINIESKCDGMTMPEAIFYVEGWLTKVKEKYIQTSFGNMNLR